MKKRLVVLPLAMVAACSGVTESPDQDAAPAADATTEPSSGGSSGSPAEDAAADQASGGSSDSGADQEQDCGPWGASGADPEPAPLNCNLWENGKLLKVGGAVDGTTLEIRLEYYGGIGSWTELNAVVSPELGTLQSVDGPSGAGEIYPAVVVNIALAPGAAEGTVTFSGVLHGRDQCKVTVACPVQRVLQVKLPESGPPQIALSAPERLGPRQRVERQAEALFGKSVHRPGTKRSG